MSLMKKLKTLVKLSSEAPLRQLVEANDIEIFEQELREAEVSIKSAKMKLALMKTEKSVITKDAEALKQRISLREQQTLELMSKVPVSQGENEAEKNGLEKSVLAKKEDDQELLLELAGQIAEDEKILSDLFAQQKHLAHAEAKLTAKLKDSIRTVQSHYRQLQIAKANKSSLHAHAELKAIVQPHSTINSSIRELDESLSSIKLRQDRAALMVQAEEDVEASLGSSLMEQKLRDAGVTSGNHDAQAVLSRLKSKAT